MTSALDSGVSTNDDDVSSCELKLSTCAGTAEPHPGSVCARATTCVVGRRGRRQRETNCVSIAERPAPWSHNTTKRTSSRTLESRCNTDARHSWHPRAKHVEASHVTRLQTLPHTTENEKLKYPFVMDSRELHPFRTPTLTQLATLCKRTRVCCYKDKPTRGQRQ
jgi:hypothetical protein